MIKIDPQRINILRHVASSKRKHAEALADAVSAEMQEVDILRGEILKVTRRRERTGAGAEELAQLRQRQRATQGRHAEATERAEVAQEDARAARRLLTRCDDFVAARAGGGDGF